MQACKQSTVAHWSAFADSTTVCCVLTASLLHCLNAGNLAETQSAEYIMLKESLLRKKLWWEEWLLNAVRGPWNQLRPLKKLMDKLNLVDQWRSCSSSVIKPTHASLLKAPEGKRATFISNGLLSVEWLLLEVGKRGSCSCLGEAVTVPPGGGATRFTSCSYSAAAFMQLFSVPPTFVLFISAATPPPPCFCD